MATTLAGPPDPGVATDDETLTAHQAALLREREGYIRRGDAKRVAGVEAALVASGFELIEQATSKPTATAKATTK